MPQKPIKMIPRIYSTKTIGQMLAAIRDCGQFEIDTDTDVVDDELESIVVHGRTQSGERIEVFRSLKMGDADAWITRHAKHLFNLHN